MKWNTYKPKINGRYLVCTKSGFIDIGRWANDLYKVDDYDFANCKGKAGWYDYNTELGYFEWSYDRVIAWMPLPEPFEKED